MADNEEFDPDKQAQADLKRIIAENSQLETYADFSVSDGEINYTFKLNPCDYDVSFQEHFFLKYHPEAFFAAWINQFYKQMYVYVLHNLPEGWSVKEENERLKAFQLESED